MPGLSLRDLLCCCPQSSDTATHPNSPVTPQRRLEDDKPIGDGDGQGVTGVSNVEGSAGAKANGDEGASGGSTRARVASEESSKTPAATQGTSIVVAGDEKGSVQRMKDWFNEKIGEGGLGTALKITNSALGQAKDITGILSVPGAELTIGIVLFIISNVQTSIKNNKTFEDLREFLSSLSSIILVPLTQSDVSKSGMVYQRVESFLQEIIKHSRKLVDLEPSSGVIRFLKAKFIEGELSEFSRSIQEAITNFQMVLNIGNAVVLERLDKALDDMKRQLNSIDHWMDLQWMDKQLEKLLRKEISDASFDYQRNIELCHGDTCAKILSEIKAWALNVKVKQGQVFWLRGRAGTGKSTIAKTIAEWAEEEGILGSIFFFARDTGGDSELSKSNYLLPAIAYGVAKFDTSLKGIISRVLEGKLRSVFEYNIEKQFQTLIAEPLAELSKDSGSPRKLMLLIIDSLDECDKQEDVEDVIRLVLNLLAPSNPHIRVFVTSRPETHIQEAFGNVGHQPIIRRCEIEDYLNSKDVGNYLYDGLHKRYPETEWWENEAFESLVKYSGNLFIYASTALRYIRNAKRLGQPEKRIAELLDFNTDAASGDSPHEQLDKLYLGVLNQAVATETRADSPDMVRLRNIFGAIMQLGDYWQMSVSTFAELLGTDVEGEEPVKTLGRNLEDLHSVIVLPPPEELYGRVRFFHQSFPDFLKDQKRCTKRFFIDSSDTEAFLSRRCLEVMIASLGNSKRHSTGKSSALEYACKNWDAHLSKTRNGDVQVKNSLEKFVWNHLHGWTKTMKKTEPSGRVVYRSVLSLETAQDWARNSGCNKELQDTIISHFQVLVNGELPQVTGATYGSVSSTGRIDACYPGTRAGLLKQVKEWARNMDTTTPSIFWLCESGGTGKSAVAMSVAQWAAEDGDLLGSSFFFDKQAPRCDLKSFISTIAHDIALFQLDSDSSKRRSVANVLDKHRNDTEALVAGLLTVFDFENTILLVVDALDECDEDVAEKIIALLSTLSESRPCLRIFLSSRPEPHIVDAFHREGGQLFNCINANAKELDAEDNQGIEKYLRDELSRAYVDVDWQKREDFEELLKQCGDLFIHAATALRYVLNRDGNHIADVLRLYEDASPDEAPYERLTRFYEAILRDFLGDESNLNSEEMMQTRRIIGMISELRNTLPVGALVELLGVDETSLRKKLEGLSCVIAVPSPDKPNAPVRFLHRSLSDFLKGRQRAVFDQLLINVQDLEACIAHRCLEVMIEGLPGKSSETFTPGLRYADKYWVEHLTEARCGDTQVAASLEIFIQQRHLLKWLIVHTDNLRHCVSTLRNTHNWAVKSKCTDNLSEIIQGVLRFVLLEKRVYDLRDTFDKTSTYRTMDIGVCVGETSKAILSKVKDWVKPPKIDVTNRQPQMFWLKGGAGTGKSTIAMTIATWANEEGLLGYNNLLSVVDRCQLIKFPYLIHHIAYCLCKYEPSLAESVTKALLEVGVLYEGVAEPYQVQDTALDPLRSTHEHGSENLLLVVDALDEIDDAAAVHIVIRFLTTLAKLNPHIRVLISSRPEQHIQAAFDKATSVLRFEHCAIEEFIGARDIKEYLHHELEEYADSSWPSEGNIDSLVTKSGNLFAYASTASKFIKWGPAGNSGGREERLETMIGIDCRVSRDNPYIHLDDLYSHILNQAIGDNQQVDSTSTERLRRILEAIVVSYDPQNINTKQIVGILEEDWKPFEARASASVTKKDLAGVQSLVGHDHFERPYFLHSSVPEFLSDRNRCSDVRFYINVPHLESFLFQRSLKIITEGLAAQSTKTNYDSMEFACRHWASYLKKTPYNDAQAAESLCAFVRRYLLRWLKVAKEFADSPEDLFEAVEIARNWVAASIECDKDTLHTLDDVFRSFKSMHALLPRSNVDYLASYNYQKFVQESCFPGTRVAILEMLKEWTMCLDETVPNIFWLSGLPRSGKRSIAMSFADWASEKGILGVSLFCRSKWTKEVSTSDVLPAIVHEIASFDNSIGKLIIEALENSPDREMGLQFEQLVAKPLRSAKLDSPILLIVDVLDRCQKNEAVEMLKLFLTHLSGSDHSHVRVLITSRPEPHICDVFHQYKGAYKFLDLDEVRDTSLDVQQEIGNYLRKKMCQIHAELDLPRPDGWPDQRDIDSLASNSGGLFSYASQALDCMSNSRRRDPAEGLRMWLDYPPKAQADYPHSLSVHLVHIYFTCFELDHMVGITVSYEEIVRALAAVVLLQEPQLLEALADLLGADKGTLKILFRRFHPAIIVPHNPQDPLRAFHPSLREFLTDREELRRNNLLKFFVDVPKHEAYLCQRCLEIIAEGVIRDSGVRVIEGGKFLSPGELRNKVDGNHNSVLRYGCTYWAAHLLKVNRRKPQLSEAGSEDSQLSVTDSEDSWFLEENRENSHLKERLEDFIRKHILIWMETMSLLHLTQNIIPSIQTACKFMSKSGFGEESNLQELLSDSIQFAEKNLNAIAESPLQIWPLLLDLPQDSLLRRTYKATAEERLQRKEESNHGASDVTRTPQWLWRKVKSAVLPKNRVVNRIVDGMN